MAKITTKELIKQAKHTHMKLSAKVVHALLQKGLKANWTDQDFVGFLFVMADLHHQTKNWEWPSDSLYMTLDPRSLNTLILCLQERKEKNE